MRIAFIIKFDENTENPYFQGRVFLNRKRVQPKSDLPHWEVCEPRIRKHLGKCSILFFAPKGTWRVKYVLRVDENASEAGAKEMLGERWAKFHERMACSHSGVSRYGNIIIGSPEHSFRLGDGLDIGPYVPGYMRGKGKRNNGRKFSTFREAQRLYAELKKLG